MKKLFLALMAVVVMASCGGSDNGGGASISDADATQKVTEAVADIDALTAELQNVRSLGELKSVGQKYQELEKKYNPTFSKFTRQQAEKIGAPFQNSDERFRDSYMNILGSYRLSDEESNVYSSLIGITVTTHPH